ncbi:hypothetical protein ABT168_07945 [Streptomyces sp. NPDC001793]|uniref:hypothetical protein n=1 Tax=Streptomyces sp. NPDC001793 TaxID=3154657 RepID=UPI0033207669
MSTVRSSRLTRGARRTAASACLLLAASGAAWLVRDAVALPRPTDVLAAPLGTAPGTAVRRAASVCDPLLAAVGLGAALAVRRRAATAPGALLSLAAAAALLRLPLLWAPGADGSDGALAAWARATALAELLLAAALFAVVAAGRRPVPDPLAGVAAAYGVVQEAPRYGTRSGAPGSPYRRPAAALAVLLGAAALTLAAGELYALRRLGADGYRAALLGAAAASGSALRPPPHWTAAALAVLAAAAAVAALRRAPWARPAALTAGLLLLGHGGARLDDAVRTGALGRLAALPGTAQIGLAAAVLVALAGLGALLVAALPGLPDATAGARPPEAYGDGPDAARPRHAPPPPSARPPGW